MKNFKMFCCGLMAAVMTMSMAGCQLVDKFTGNNVAEETPTDNDSSIDSAKVVTIDKSLEAPQFSNVIRFNYKYAQGTEVSLDGTAVVNDGGKVTYQWYSNNVDSNGGGTKLSGATNAIYKPDTSSTGVKFYYVVAKNDHGEKCNMSTSMIARVEVIAKGEWTADEFGGIRYLSAEGTFPADVKVCIDGSIYLFDSNGYRFSGWIYDDAYYYFDEEGRMIVNNPDYAGYSFDALGRLQGDADPLGLFPEQTAEEVPAEVPAEEVPAE